VHAGPLAAPSPSRGSPARDPGLRAGPRPLPHVAVRRRAVVGEHIAGGMGSAGLPLPPARSEAV
jgi:hypothetical protein